MTKLECKLFRNFHRVQLVNIRLYDSDIVFGIPFEEDMFIIINFGILHGINIHI